MRALAIWCFRHRWTVVLAWLIVIVGITTIHTNVGSNYTNNFSLPHTQSHAADQLLQRTAPRSAGDTEQVVIAVTDRHGHRSRGPGPGRAAAARAAALPAGQPDPLPLRRSDRSDLAVGRIAFANVTFDVGSDKVSERHSKRFVSIITHAAGPRRSRSRSAARSPRTRSRRAPTRACRSASRAAAVVLFLVFGSLLAALAAADHRRRRARRRRSAIDRAALATSSTWRRSAQQLSLLIGLGVGVDYALFIVTRYRQGLLRGQERRGGDHRGASTPPAARSCSPA